MGDKQLLELAAKAVGHEIYWLDLPLLMINGNCAGEWNPLESDADAFRLMVDLKLLVDTDYNDCVAAGNYQLSEILEPIGNDRGAATRRAIVMAAAEIGKAKGGN